MNGKFVHNAQLSTLLFVAIDHCTIFYFFLQISLDNSGKMAIMKVKRTDKGTVQTQTTACIRAGRDRALDGRYEREKMVFTRRKQL